MLIVKTVKIVLCAFHVINVCFECKKCIKCENSNKCIKCYEDLNSKFQSKYLFNCKNCKGYSGLINCNNINCKTSKYFNKCKNCNGLIMKYVINVLI